MTTESDTVTAPTGAVTGRALTALLAGRVALRSSGYIRVLVLLAVWGSTRYNDYAGAVGLCGWMLYLAAGAEKAGLKLVPRTRRLTADLVRRVVLLAATPAALALLVVVAVVAVGGLSAALYPAAALDSTALGLLFVSSGLQRMAGNPRRDMVGNMILAGAVGVMTTAAWRLDLEPVHYLLGVAATALLIATWQLLRLPSDWWRGTGGRRVGALVVRSAFMLGITDLLGALTYTSCYAVLRLYGRGDESTELYLSVIVASGGMAVMLTLMRIFQPRISARQRGGGALPGRQRAARLLRGAVVGAGLCGGALVVGAVAGVAQVPLLGACALMLIVLFGFVSYAVTLIENTDGRALSITVTGAAVELVATAALGFALVPIAGAAGALTALVFAIGINAAATGHLLRRRYDLSTPGLLSRP